MTPPIPILRLGIVKETKLEVESLFKFIIYYISHPLPQYSCLPYNFHVFVVGFFSSKEMNVIYISCLEDSHHLVTAGKYIPESC